MRHVYVRAFLDRYVRGLPSPLLDGPSPPLPRRDLYLPRTLRRTGGAVRRRTPRPGAPQLEHVETRTPAAGRLDRRSGVFESERIGAAVKILLNIIWLVLAGIWLALGYVFAAVLLAITIIGIPFTVQAFKLAGYALWPFGRTLVPAERRNRGLNAFANVLWFILAGWWLAFAHLFAGIALCITIIGIPLGLRASRWQAPRSSRSVRRLSR